MLGAGIPQADPADDTGIIRCDPHPGRQRPANPVGSDLRTDEGPEQRTARGRAPASRGSRLTLSGLPQDWETWTREHRPDLDPAGTWDAFADYWCAKPGKDGTKADWFATWRNWCRRERPANPGPGQHRTAGPEPTGPAYRLLTFED